MRAPDLAAPRFRRPQQRAQPTRGHTEHGNPIDACKQSPARLPEAITVSATSRTDVKGDFANHGACVDLFAPGVGIVSAFKTSDTASTSYDGTSQAAPHVAGAVARYLSAHPSATPAQVQAALISGSTTGVVRNGGPDSPNRLLHLP
ncbi:MULTISPECIES: S8 family serine peptidase [unclassified Crossiella]|uniref:S8 family serine peptidase n=1 Tax=unclassified Crossiella TaxID=2620835 RepID=UPI001FFFA664|nr:MULTISPECIES: S8 family serine peptidase [unclassified Crossiella]MCK2238789.1 S8 family serine peptidase [Crossiella sp. S99.2]MCK2251641.1 S8 family serine peptidase [Crossiella sp. S99.1]